MCIIEGVELDNSVLVSIITVCFNSEKTIEKTIKSVLSQTYMNYEHIFIDGGSTDATMDIIRRYQDAYGTRCRLYTGKDKGIYDAMNKGIDYAKGDLIGIINSDDWYAEDALEHVVQTYLSTSDKEVVITGDLVRTTLQEEFLYLQRHNDITLTGLTKGMPLQHPAVFVAKSVYEKLGTFDISYRYLADYDFIWRCFDSKCVSFAFTHSVTSYMREGGASDTFKFQNIKDRTKERYRLRSKYIGKPKAWMTSAYFFLSEIAKQTMKRVLGKSVKDKYYALKHKN